MTRDNIEVQAFNAKTVQVPLSNHMYPPATPFPTINYASPVHIME